MTKHGFLLGMCALISLNLSSQVHVILVQLLKVDLVKNLTQVPRRYAFLTLVDVHLGCPEVLNHLEGTLQA